MTADFEGLRKPFPPELIGRTPATQKRPAFDFVGHAATTDRLIQCAPGWELRVNERFDAGGDCWVEVTLSIDGISRSEYGSGGDPKKAISNALRRAAMRFGVALDLWSKEDLDYAEARPVGSGEQERDPDPPAAPADGDLSDEVSESKTSPGETSEGGMVSEESSERAASLPRETPPEDEPATAEQWARAEALGISGNTALRQVRAAIRKGELEGEPPANQSAISRDQLAHVILQKVPA